MIRRAIRRFCRFSFANRQVRIGPRPAHPSPHCTRGESHAFRSFRTCISLFVGPALAAAPAASAPATAVEKSAADDSGAKKLGFQLILQSWTTNRFTVAESIDYAKKLGLHGIEIFPGQALAQGARGSGARDGAADIKLMLDTAKAADVKIMDTGVIGIPDREDEARKLFDWAKKMGITEIVSEPNEKSLPMIDKLAAEYNIKVAIHDHPKPSHYWDPEYTFDKIKDFKHIGFCADVGHWKRSGLDPVAVLEEVWR